MSGRLSAFWEHGQGWARPTARRSAWHLYRHGRTACGVYSWPAELEPRMAGESKRSSSSRGELVKVPPDGQPVCGKCRARSGRPLRRFWRYMRERWRQ